MNGDPCLRTLVDDLGAVEVFRRLSARRELTAMGRHATPALLEALTSQSDRVRWEVCKTFLAIKDPRSAPALAEMLRDDVMAVRWVAAEALIALGAEAEAPVLRALGEHADSRSLCEAAYHLLSGLDCLGVLGPATRALLPILPGQVGGTRIAVTARTALSLLDAGVSQ